MEKLKDHRKYETIYNEIKQALKDDDRISKDQVKDYDRRLKRSPLLEIHFEMLLKTIERRIDLHNKNKRLHEENKQLKEKIKYLEDRLEKQQI
jgi:hypothetical protein